MTCVVVEDEPKNNYILVRIHAQKDALKLLRSKIASREKGDCEATTIYEPPELADDLLKKMNPDGAQQWLNYAKQCEAWTAYAEAKDAYEKAAADETFLSRKSAQDGATRCDAILRDMEAVKDIRFLKSQLYVHQWNTLREGIAGFADKHPTA